MIRATLDTNVLVSGLAGLDVSTSTPGAIVRHWLEGAFELIISAAILAELERTLTKPYFRSRRSSRQIEAALATVVRVATIIVPTSSVSGIATHPEDELILATAVSGRVDCLVTGDRMVQRIGSYQGVRLLSPREFLDVLESDESNRT